MGSLPEKNLKITFLTDAPFIMKFRFDLPTIQIFEAPLSDNHSTRPQNVLPSFEDQKRTRHEPKGGQLVSLPILSDDTVPSFPII